MIAYFSRPLAASTPIKERERKREREKYYIETETAGGKKVCLKLGHRVPLIKHQGVLGPHDRIFPTSARARTVNIRLVDVAQVQRHIRPGHEVVVRGAQPVRGTPPGTPPAVVGGGASHVFEVRGDGGHRRSKLCDRMV